MTLTGRDKRFLRSLAHHLEPTVLVGGDRLSDGLVKEVDRALGDHELIKVKLIDADKPEVTEAREVLCERTGASHVQTIGHVLVLFRRRDEKPKVPPLPGERDAAAAAAD